MVRGFLFLRPCEDACGLGLSIGIRGKYDMGNEVKLYVYAALLFKLLTLFVPNVS